MEGLVGMGEINAIYQFNEKYVPYAGASVTSLLVNNADAAAVNIYVLGEGLSDRSKQMLEKAVNDQGGKIIFPDTALLLEKFAALGMIPYRGAYSVYLRLFFTQLPEADALSGKRVLYLDADTIVDRSLLPLFGYDLGGMSIGMVKESIRDDYRLMIGMDPSSDYYNSGVILFDVDKWRENMYCDRLFDHIKNVRSSYIGDQDFLNIVCCGDVCSLPPEYNFQPLHKRYSVKQYERCYGLQGYYPAADIEAAAKSPAIYHCYRWLGEFPWDKDNLHPFGDKFDKYLGLSPWKDYVKKKADASFATKAEKVLYRLLPKSVFLRIFKKTHEMMLGRAEADARRQKANTNA